MVFGEFENLVVLGKHQLGSEMLPIKTIHKRRPANSKINCRSVKSGNICNPQEYMETEAEGGVTSDLAERIEARSA